MTLKSDQKPDHASVVPRGLKWHVRAAAFALMWEQVWPALWPALGFVGLFLIVTFADLWRFVPGFFHALFLGAGVVACSISLRRNFVGLTWPTPQQCLRRIELKSGLAHRPLTSLQDRLAQTGQADAGREALWQLHHAGLRKSMGTLRIGPPRSDMARRDPQAIRMLIILGVVATFFLSDGDWKIRLARAVQPGNGAQIQTASAIDAWVNTPTYTGRPPIFLTRLEGAGKAPINIAVPAGAQLVVRVGGHEAPPQMSLRARTSEAKKQPVEFRQIGPEAFEYSRELGDSLEVTIGEERTPRHAWIFDVHGDQVPKIDFVDALTATERHALRISYEMSDDYGVANALAEIRLKRPDDRGTSLDALLFADHPPIILELALPSLRTKEAKGALYEDLTSHPWAGLGVTVQLSAEDEVGQIGLSAPAAFVLPERDFRNPLARALVEQRKTLVLFPDEAVLVARYLDAFTALPARYFEDLTVYLGLRTAYRRLLDEPGADDLASVVQLLWDIAVRLEDGDATMAAAQVRDLQRQLMDALADSRPQDEIDKIMRALRQAIQRYTQALVREGMKDMQRGDMPPPTGDGKQIGQQDLDALLKKLEQMLRAGDMEGAAQMMAQVMDMLENMQFGGLGPGGTPGGSPMGEALDQLGDMIGRQRGLMDRTFKESSPAPLQRPGHRSGQRPGQRSGQGSGRPSLPNLEDLLRGDPFGQEEPGQEGLGQSRESQAQGSQPSDSGGQNLAQEQEDLRRQLEEIMRGVGREGEIPGALERALSAMEQSQESLGQGNLSGSVTDQKRAIDQLHQGASAMAEAMLEQLERQGGKAGGRSAGARDPLGRPQAGAGNGPQMGDSVRVPEERDLQKAREILEELRRRAGELGRPSSELDYLDRLLRRF